MSRRGTFDFEATGSGLISNQANVEALRRLWLDAEGERLLQAFGRG